MATTVKFVKDATNGLSINPGRFLGAIIQATGKIVANFEKTTGATTGTSSVLLNVTDGAAGVEQKRVFQALANGMGGHPRHGAVVEIADDLSGAYIHEDITSIQSISL
tara:strand:- start:1090 stop:1413 length:324 start_codon:yes stop_codon:yes gene_type:complete